MTDPSLAILIGWLWPALLLSFRLTPIFAFAPPFSLVPVPAVFRVLLGVGAAASLSAMGQSASTWAPQDFGAIAVSLARELFVGAVFVVALQVAFAGLYIAGRTIDMQVGFGLAALIDPATKGRTPLVGTLFAWLAGAVFFAMDGPANVLRAFATSLKVAPLGQAHVPVSLLPLTELIGAALTLGLGMAGGTILSLFVVDLSIAALTRALPQMNVLVPGFQVKSLLLLVTLPISFGLSGAFFVRLFNLTLTSIPKLL